MCARVKRMYARGWGWGTIGIMGTGSGRTSVKFSQIFANILNGWPLKKKTILKVKLPKSKLTRDE